MSLPRQIPLLRSSGKDNAMNLDRTKPKQKKAHPKCELTAEKVDNPSADGLGGKAGKTISLLEYMALLNFYPIPCQYYCVFCVKAIMQICCA